MSKRNHNRLRHFIDLYSKGLSRSEVESLITRETAEAFFFFERQVENRGRKTTTGDWVSFGRGLLMSFIMHLRPARRLVYGIAMVTFLMGFLFKMHPMYTLGGFLLLNFLLALELADKLMAKSELEIARAIQLGLQPPTMPNLPRIDMAAHYQPAREVGGDYYDFAKGRDGQLAIMMGDVSGKGIAAALYAVRLQGLFQLLAKESETPKAALMRMNALIAERMEANFFITAAMALLDTQTGQVHLARAGHNPPLLVHGDGRVEALKPAGLGLNVGKPEQFNAVLSETTLRLQTGDLLVFYTDGLTEAMNRKKETYGEQRLAAFCQRHRDDDATTFKTRLISEWEDFLADRPADDDVTLVILKAT